MQKFSRRRQASGQLSILLTLHDVTSRFLIMFSREDEFAALLFRLALDVSDAAVEVGAVEVADDVQSVGLGRVEDDLRQAERKVADRRDGDVSVDVVIFVLDDDVSRQLDE